jgi:hypothetical protein
VGTSIVVRVPTGRRHRCEVEGVVKVAEDVVAEELLGESELAVGSAGWGNNRSGPLPVRRSQRMTVAGKSRRLASLAGAVGRLLAQEGAGMRSSFWPGRTTRGGSSMMGNGG